jgi:hypothetical protein
VKRCYTLADRQPSLSTLFEAPGSSRLGRVAKAAGEPVEGRGEAEAGVVVAGELV